MIIFLDSNILGLLCNVNGFSEGVDIIISAHYRLLVDTYPGQQVIVATKNLKHISRFCQTANWQDIKL